MRTISRTSDAAPAGAQVVDTDARQDVYERSGGQTTLVSTGPAGGNGAVDAFLAGASADTARVFLETEESLISADTDISQDVYVKRIPAPSNAAAPAISGTAAVGQTLGCSQGSWANDPTSFAYQWNRDGAAIAGATSSSYTVTDADVARQITCTVTAANADGGSSATSAPVTPTAAPSAPVTPTAPPSGGAPPSLVPDPRPGLPPGPLAGACANTKTGSAGPDALTGSAFGDTLRGLAGNDVLIGLAGDDCLSGGNGNDTLTAGAGNDTLTGGNGKDKFDAGGGNDTINSRDKRRETVRCGTGKKDRVTADRSDRLIGCEKVKRR
jgi:Ca2+-binding RTX toxin-like protein